MSFHRKTNRLDLGLYTAPHAYSLTLCTEQRGAHFRDPHVVETCLLVLRETFANVFDVYAYCFMPDHLHFLLAARTDGADVISCLKIFKQRTAFQVKQQFGIRLWQKSFHDHIVRRDEGLDAVAKYILNNPVRAGLATDFRDYPFLGSLVFDPKELTEVMAG